MPEVNLNHTAAEVDDAVDKAHVHGNLTVLGGIKDDGDGTQYLDSSGAYSAPTPFDIGAAYAVHDHPMSEVAGLETLLAALEARLAAVEALV